MKNLSINFLFYLFLLSLLSCDKTDTHGLPEALPKLETEHITSITQTSAVSGGSIISDGGSAIISKGVCWNSMENPTIRDNFTIDGAGVEDFTSSLMNLNANCEYFVRAYATNNEGTSYGQQRNFKTLMEGDKPSEPMAIIADHTIIEQYNDIPQQWIDSVKKMWLSLAGESHALAYLRGLVALEAIDSRFDVNYSFETPPQPPTDRHLRADLNSWGDVEHESGWIWGYGEEDWFTSPLAISRTRAGIKYCNDNNYKLSAYGFVLCYDGSIMDATDYLKTTQGYSNYCDSAGYNTTIFFATGAVDDLNGQADERGYNKYLMYEDIRNYVKADPSRVLFDYADILYYDDGSQTPYTVTWNGHTFPVITPTNAIPSKAGHIGAAGELRLAKAMWWMLARIAGWEGK